MTADPDDLKPDDDTPATDDNLPQPAPPLDPKPPLPTEGDGNDGDQDDPNEH